MQSLKSIPIIDLFAGPGGLGEGFSSFDEGKRFKIAVSVEMDAAAHKTLKLRAYFRKLKENGLVGLIDYYKFCNDEAEQPYSQSTRTVWDEAGQEAQQLTLGSPNDDVKLAAAFKKHKLNKDSPWVLIGGPPCQAYSLVGSARNKGKSDYSAAADHRQ